MPEKTQGKLSKRNYSEKSLTRRAMEYFFLGMAYGLGQALGLTLIFALVLSYLSRLISAFGGLPFVGEILADLVKATENALQSIK
ncbi:MAG TPA: DUF5665 domain-containing protein [Candidatus Bathyarchaeia archaeon]|nr:DUF5665 domain-containing protein [Candidatus Bathyarchaeia archaeon]